MLRGKEAPMDPKKWKKLKKTLWISVFLWSALAVAASIYFWGPKAGGIAILGSLCLASGFYITELLIGVMTGVKKANPTAIGLLGVGKLGWWAGLFWLSRHISSETQMPLALGMGAFLVSILTVVLLQYGMPKISDNS